MGFVGTCGWKGRHIRSQLQGVVWIRRGPTPRGNGRPAPTQIRSRTATARDNRFGKVNSAHGIATIGLKRWSRPRGGIGVEAGTCSLGKSGVIILPRRDNDIKISVMKAGPPRLGGPFFYDALSQSCLCQDTATDRTPNHGARSRNIPPTAGVTRRQTATRRAFEPKVPTESSDASGSGLAAASEQQRVARTCESRRALAGATAEPRRTPQAYGNLSQVGRRPCAAPKRRRVHEFRD